MAAIQIIRFRLAEGTDESTFRAVNERFQREIAPTLPGLERREATVADDGEWVLVLRYAGAEDAGRARAGDTSEVSRAFVAGIDMSTMSSTVLEVVSE